MKKFLLFSALVFSFLLVGSIRAEPFSAFPGETVSLFIEEKGVERVSITHYYSLVEFVPCTKELCPVFENGELEEKGKAPGEYGVKVGKERTGNYLVKVEFLGERKPLYTSFAVQRDYSLLGIIGPAVLLAALIGVELNVFRKKRAIKG